MPPKAKTPAKTPAKAQSKAPAKTPGKTPAKTPAKSGRGSRRGGGSSSKKAQPVTEDSGTKYAGSAAFGCAPAPEALPLPRFLKNRPPAKTSPIAHLKGLPLPPSPTKSPPPMTDGSNPFGEEPSVGFAAPDSSAEARVARSKEMHVQAHDLVPFFSSSHLGQNVQPDQLQMNTQLQPVPTQLPEDQTVQIREWTEDGYFHPTTVKQVNVRSTPVDVGQMFANAAAPEERSTSINVHDLFGKVAAPEVTTKINVHDLFGTAVAPEATTQINVHDLFGMNR